MRTALLFLVTLLIATPVIAATTVTIDCVEEPDGVVRIDYTVSGDPGVVSGFALDITVAGANIVDVYGYKEGESVQGDEGYGVFPGTIQIVSGSVTSWGTPEGDTGDHLDTKAGVPSDAVTLEMGALYVEDVNKPLPSGTLCRLDIDNCSPATIVDVEENTTRGGIVMEGLAAPVVVLNDGTVTCGEPPCLQVGQQRGPDLVDQAMVDLWDSLGQPPCWCGWCQPHGDTNMDCNVTIGVDVNAIKTAYNTTVYNACADFNKDGNITIGIDVDRIKTTYNGANCPGGCVTGPYTGTTP